MTGVHNFTKNDYMLLEKEYWGYYNDLKSVMERIHSLETLDRLIINESILSAEAKSFSHDIISKELEKVKNIFTSHLYNFVSLDMSGIHWIDFEIYVKIIDEDSVDVECCNLFIDNYKMKIPVEIGIESMEHILKKSQEAPLKSIFHFFQTMEDKYDKLLNVDIGRFALEISHKLYPDKYYDLRMRLPALVIVENKDSFEV